MKRSMRILLAEDESTVSRLIKIVLAKAGHDVTGVRTIREALQELSKQSFDLVLLDANLADGHGRLVIEALEQTDAERPAVLLMTGERYFGLEDEMAPHVEAVLWKPFELGELEQIVSRFGT